ncbi:YHS domain-containing (seleno)protein [Aliiroseovarius sp. YM-037]|uniref:YHS domain-containing (seleno)protein n=1 Tax=Aliiroseovarius sp. YM-037 TaxID=3341728 RepID=UPI003A7FC794
MTTRRAFLGLLVALPVVGTIVRPAIAAAPEVFAPGGVAINGYDPIAYFTDGAPVEGSADNSVSWNGATWHFATPENKEQFAADPAAFAPQYGGYCAYAVSKGATASTEPDAWTVHDGKLYLNYSLSVRGIWQQDIPGNVALADQNWPGVLEN